jgi:hypothetical protein
MRARPRVLACCAAAFVMSTVQSVRAGEPPKAPADASNAAAAQVLFDEGVHLMEAGRFGEACPKLAASQKLDPGAGTLLDLGTCYEKNGQTASAWATFQEAENLARRAAHDDWADRAHAHVVALEPRLQRLVVAVDQGAVVPGLLVQRDGLPVEASAWGLPIPVDPGSHEVRASAPGKRDWSTTVELRTEGASSTVTVPPLEAAPAPPPPAPLAEPATSVSHESPAPPPSFWTTQRVVGVALAGAGVLGIAVGSGLGLAARAKYEDAIDNDCPGRGTACTAAGVQEGQDAHGMATASTIVFVSSATALAAGAVLFFVPFGDSRKAASPVGVAPAVAPGHASLTLMGAW